MSKVIVVSNRVPTDGRTSGGLVVALRDALEEGGIWIGSHPDPGDTSEGLTTVPGSDGRRMTFRLSEDDVANYYLGYSNSVLWPLCHRRADLVDMPTSFEEAYRSVNARVARLIADIAEPDDLIWVHDYHFFPLARELRACGLTNRIGFFLHVPFPAPDDLSVLSQPEEFADWLADYNLLGLQTRGDIARCMEMYRADPRAEFMTDGTVKMQNRITSVRSFPIGIDVDDFRAMAEAKGPNPFGREAPECFVIGVDRLDYSKGIPNRFRAFGRYLESRPDGNKCSKCSLVQIAPPSREEVQAYQDITSELEEIVGRLNGAYSELDWTPIRYIHRSVDRATLARLFRMARACAVTSLADGMNLVAKEYVAAQDPEDPGVLILSRFAGAAEDMTEALLINPHDIENMASALQQAFDMPLEERRERHAACLKVVEDTDAAEWARQFLRALRTCLPTLDRPFASSQHPRNGNRNLKIIS